MNSITNSDPEDCVTIGRLDKYALASLGNRGHQQNWGQSRGSGMLTLGSQAAALKESVSKEESAGQAPPASSRSPGVPFPQRERVSGGPPQCLSKLPVLFRDRVVTEEEV